MNIFSVGDKLIWFLRIIQHHHVVIKKVEIIDGHESILIFIYIYMYIKDITVKYKKDC